MTTRKLFSISAIAVITAGFASNASAQLWAYEPFDYAAGSDLNGQSGGLGFTSAWRDASTAGGVIQASSLAGPAGLPTSGGSALLSGELGTYTIFRDFTTIAGTAGTTTWISFLGQRQGQQTVSPTDWPDNPYPRGVNSSFFTAGGGSELIGVGNSSNAATNEWSIIPNGSGARRESVTQSGVGYENLEWAVLRIDNNGAGSPDSAYLWLNPDPLGGEPSIGSANVQFPSTEAQAFDYSNMGAFRPFIGNESSSQGSSNWRPFGVLAIDELRIGGDWASMTAVPEPSSFALLGLAGLGLLVRRFRR